MQEVDSGRGSPLVVAVELATASLTVLVRVPFRKYQVSDVLRVQEHAFFFLLRRSSKGGHLKMEWY